jgi:anaerobic ribonucleoside-triphosphate reductase activating protein
MKLDTTFLIIDRPIPVADPDRIQFTSFQARSYVAGPGCRCVLWVAGCHRRCPGCFQEHFFNFNAGKSIRVEQLAQQIICLEEIDGFTISGGEPFEQSESLAKLCKLVRQGSNLSILAYTGYKLAVLQNRTSADRLFLDQLDWLIDGEYRQEQSGPYLWRGSANQNLRDLNSSSPTSNSVQIPDGDQESVQLVLEDDSLIIGGFPAPGMDDLLRKSLAQRGIILGDAKRSYATRSTH